MKIRDFFLAAMLVLAMQSANAGDCVKNGTICTDTTAAKNVSGIIVSLAQMGGCWTYTDTYSCLEPGVNFCAPLVSAGCTVTNSECNSYAFNGSCESYTKTYRCGNAISNPTNVVVLANSYTLVQDTIDRSACSEWEVNASCGLAETTCTEGPETRTINGLPVYKDCWKSEEKYACSAGTFSNYCAPLEASDCALTGSVCKITASWDSNLCIEYERSFNCNAKIEPIPVNVTLLDSQYTIVEDTILNTCTASAGNPNCTLAGTVCTEGPETRNINGLDVYRACWKTEKQYVCAATALTSGCGELQANPACLEVTTPICIDALPGGQCSLLEHTYECGIGDEVTREVTDCSAQTFCLDGSCFDTGYPLDTDFGTAISALEAMREAATYGLFKGEAATCASKRAFGLSNCCKNSSGGAGGSNSILARAAGSVVTNYAQESIVAWGSPYVYEALFDAAMLFDSTMMMTYAMSVEMSATLAASANASITVFGVTISNAAPIYGPGGALISEGGLSFAAFDPYTLMLMVAVMVIQEMMACEPEEQVTAMKRGQGLCHHVGSYCESQILGVCRVKQESYCCFVSKLARIIQEQGRGQIGKTWGSARTPDCSAFTLEQIASLDFSLIDFTEFIQSIAIPSKSSDFAIQRASSRAASYYTP